MWVITLFRSIRAYRKFHKNMRELAALHDHTLRDIGISRSEVMGRAWEQAWR